MLERTTEIGPPITYPSTCRINLPSAKKVQPFHNLFNNFMETDFLHKAQGSFERKFHQEYFT